MWTGTSCGDHFEWILILSRFSMFRFPHGRNTCALTHASMWMTENCFQKFHARCIDCKSISHLCTVSHWERVGIRYNIWHFKRTHSSSYKKCSFRYLFHIRFSLQWHSNCARTSSITEIEEHEVLPSKYIRIWWAFASRQFLLRNPSSGKTRADEVYRNVNINSTLMVFNVPLASHRFLPRSLHRNNVSFIISGEPIDSISNAFGFFKLQPQSFTFTRSCELRNIQCVTSLFSNIFFSFLEFMFNRFTYT